MNRKNEIIIIIIASLILGAVGFFGMRYFLMEDGPSAGKPPKGYNHPYISSASAVIRPPENPEWSSTDIVLSLTFRNDSPATITGIIANVYDVETSYTVSSVHAEIGEGQDFPSVPIKPGETVTFSATYYLDSWSSMIDDFENKQLKVGILHYQTEEGSFVNVTGSTSAYADTSDVFMVPISVTDRR